MKIQILFLSFLCGSLGAVLDEERMPELRNKTRRVLKDIRLIPINKAPTRLEQNQKDWEDRLQEEPNGSNLERKKIITRALEAKSGKENNLRSDSNEGSDEPMRNNKEYIQKMANQLFLAQKQVSILSDYQKSILSQDPLVKRFVFGPSEEARMPKPFSHFRRRSRLTHQNSSQHSTTEAPSPTKKFDSEPELSHKSDNVISKPHNDNFAEAADINYVTIAPKPSTGHINVKVFPQKDDLVQTPTPYLFYDVTVSQKPQIEAIPVSTIRVPQESSSAIPKKTSKVTSRASSRASRYIQDSVKNVDYQDQNFGHAKYEFKYNIRDKEKNSHFGHMEARSDETTYGYYFVHLPDGRLETVKYWADKTGYHAKVDYQGEAKHPPSTEYKHHQLYH